MQHSSPAKSYFDCCEPPLPAHLPVRCALVFAAFFAAAERSAGPLVRDAFFAASLREEADLFMAAVCACFERALGEAASVLSFFNAFTLAFDRVGSTAS